MPAVSGPLLQSAALPVGSYSPFNTYIAIVASDGDNMQVIYNFLQLAVKEAAALMLDLIPNILIERLLLVA